MQITENLTNQLLIAMPTLDDPNFARTVTYICEHSADGAMGIIINRPLNIRLGDIYQQLDIESAQPQAANQWVFLGGPVQTDRGFVLHTGQRDWASTLRVSDSIRITTSKDILEAMAHGDGPEHSLVALGYAGWSGGQLEREIAANSWLSAPGNDEIMFSVPPELRWQAAAQQLGIDLSLLSVEAGHA